jgi:hypothetical protein
MDQEVDILGTKRNKKKSCGIIEQLDMGVFTSSSMEVFVAGFANMLASNAITAK